MAIERRDSTRLTPEGNPKGVLLMDWTGLHITRGRLVNISLEGALILTDVTFVPDRPFWIRLQGAPRTGWIKATAVRYGRANEMGIRFCHLCPRDFLLAAVSEIDSPRRAGRDEVPPHLEETRSQGRAARETAEERVTLGWPMRDRRWDCD